MSVCQGSPTKLQISGIGFHTETKIPVGVTSPKRHLAKRLVSKEKGMVLLIPGRVEPFQLQSYYTC